MNGREIDQAFEAYVTCALWSSTDDAGEPLDSNYSEGDLAPATLAAMRSDMEAFIAGVEDAQDEHGTPGFDGIDPAQVGHDFWLTRNHHGAGFWDLGLGAQGDYLTDVAQAYGGCDLYVGDDGQIWAA